MLVSLLAHNATCDTNVQGGKMEGRPVIREEFGLIQNKFTDYANDLHIAFSTYQFKPMPHIAGWNVTISRFTSSSAQQGLDRKILYVNASLAIIDYLQEVEIVAEFWLDPCSNTMTHEQWMWTQTPPIAVKAVPDYGWTVGSPYEDVSHPGQYLHVIEIANLDSSDAISFTSFTYLAHMTWYNDLSTIPFPSPQIPDFTLQPGKSKSIPVLTTGTFFGGHVYFKYNIGGGSFVIVDHYVTSTVGGILVPVDKFGLLAPYFGLASTILIATVATAIYVKRVKHRKEKQ